MDWNPEQYLKFADHRLRPAIDLLNRVDVTAPGLVYDLGCGAGNVTRVLRARWPEARIVGIDSSPEMLERAKKAVPDVEWVLRDVGSWSTNEPGDVIYSNAALHWLDGHQTLFPRLLGMVRPGGTLAVQMPRNHGAATHTGMFATARSGPWAAKLAGALREAPVRPPDFYWGLLSGPGVALDVWETEYLQVLQGEAPVVQWMMGTALKPLLEPLTDAEREAFVAEYTRRMAQAYPPRTDGATLLPFRRLFLVAKREVSDSVPR
jgi:trans-aconitate 2-methyltransferase